MTDCLPFRDYALEKFLSNAGNKEVLTKEEQNILYKLKVEDVGIIQEKLEETREYLRAKIQWIRLLN